MISVKFYLDKADNAFVSAYRKHHTTAGTTFFRFTKFNIVTTKLTFGSFVYTATFAQIFKLCFGH